MFPIGARSLRIGVAGDGAIREALSGWVGDSGPNSDRRLTVRSVPPEELGERASGQWQVDCLVIDGERFWNDSSEGIDEVAGRRSDVPVILLVSDWGGEIAVEALSAGATETLPRRLLDDPELLCEQVVSATRREHAQSGFRELYDGVAGVVTIHDPETGAMVHANRTLCEILGYERGELLSMDIEELTADAADDERTREMVTSVTEQGSPAEIELPLETADGSVRWIESRLDTATIGSREVVLSFSTDVTERTQLERTYRELFENVADGLVLHDPQTGEIRDVNGRFCEMNGYARDELVGASIETVTASGDAYSIQAARERFERAKAEGPQLFEWRNQRKDGEEFPVEVHLRIARIHGDECVLASVRDITERKRRERALERERDRRSVLFENNPDPVVEAEFEDGRPTITAANGSFEEVFGFDADSIGGRTVAEALVPDSERGEYEQLLERTVRGEPIEAEVRRETADGVREFLLRAIPFDAEGGDRRAYIWYTDITERKRREREREEERERYSTLVEQSSDGVAVVQGSEYAFVNDRLAEISGYDREELLGRPVESLFAPEYRDLVRERHERRIDGESPPTQYDAEIETQSGDRLTLEMAVSRIHHEGEPAVMATLRDVTERKRREEAIRALQDATEDMQTAQTVEAVVERAVEATGTVLDLPLSACWLHDADRRRLEPAAATDEVHERGLFSPLSPDHYEYEAFREGAVTEFTPSEVSEDNQLDATLLLPLGDHGLIAAGDPEEVAYDDVVLDVARALTEHTTTALDRVKRAREVRESERRLQAILDRIDEAILFAQIHELGTELPDLDFVSSGYEEIWGQSLESLHDTYEGGFFGAVHPDDEPRHRAFVDEMLHEINTGDANDRYSREYRIERPDGEVRWVHTDYYPVEWDGQAPRIVVVNRDITDRKRRERRITSFDEATDDLATAGTPGEATRTAVNAATERLGLPAVGAFLYDGEDGVLRPEVVAGPLPDEATIGPDDGPLWEAFATGTTSVSDREATERPTEGGESDQAALDSLEEWRGITLGNHGVLLVASADSPLDPDTVQAAHVLAATLEAALNHLQGQRQLAAQEQKLQTQTERADRLDRIVRLSRRVEAAITDASDPGEIERAVCERLASSGPYEVAWIGGIDVGTDRITPRAVVGTSAQYVDSLDLTATESAADAHPAVRAWQTDTVQVVDSIVSDGPTGAWRQRALGEGHQSLCAVPLTYDGITHGVLTVAADSPNRFGERIRDVLAQLGTSVGHALAAIERRRALESDETIELEFSGDGVDLPFARAARRADCRVQHERTVARQDGIVSVYFSFEDASGDVPAVASRTLPGDVDVVTEDSSSTLVEARTDFWFGSPLAEYGAVLRKAVAESGETTLVVEVPTQADVRAFTERLRELAPSLDLVAKRQHQRQERTPEELSAQITDELTDRQLEVLRTALSAGYFEWPRENDGNEVADRLGITQPTLNKHLRLAERTTFELLFDADA